jgi:4-aminobutyrate aminotransferase/(S)-3-amino-2-methylpropionate transaminase
MTTNATLLARRLAAVPRGISVATSVFADRAENAEIWDVEGKRYVDFGGGIAVLNTGHRHPRVMAAVAAQSERFTHTAFQVMAYEPYVELAEKLNARAPFTGPAKTAFFTTGAEALENAVKIARAATGRPGIVCFTGGFHGRTLMTMAMTGKVLPYKRHFGSLPGDVFHVPFPAPQNGVTVEESLKALRFLFAADIGPDRIAAIVIEPVQGEGGFLIAPTELLKALRALCDEHGILLISDEVQAGFARTGRLFGIEHSGVEPDLVTMAKSLAGGFPLSGVLGRAQYMDAPEAGGLGGTYGGNPLACAAALAVLDVIDEEKLCDRANAIGARILQRITDIQRRNDRVPLANARGYGAMIGVDIVKGDNQEPDKETTQKVVHRALELGLILLSCGTHGNVLRILVPLTVSDAVLAEGLDRFEAALAA